MKKNMNRAGFTVIELLTALAIGTILTSIAFTQLGPVRASAATRSARDSYSALYSRARAISVEHGERVLVFTEPLGDSAWIQRGNERVESIKFADDYSIDVQGSTTSAMCMTPRGFADPDCGNIDDVTEIVFEKNGSWKAVRILPFGQLEPVG